MKSVIHKFIVDDRHIGTTFDIALEADARVLYFDRDSRIERVALWVLRPAPEIDKPLDLVRRRFLVMATGDPFNAHGTLVPHGLIRIGQVILHGFEVIDLEGAEEMRIDAGHGFTITAMLLPAQNKKRLTAEDKKRGNEAATLAYREATAGGKTREEAIAISRKAWGEAAYHDHVKDERLCDVVDNTPTAHAVPVDYGQCTCPERTTESHPCAYHEELGSRSYKGECPECHCCPACEAICYQDV